MVCYSAEYINENFADKAAFLTAAQKLASLEPKVAVYEDLLATELYIDYPHITFSVGDDITNVRIVKGNSAEAAELPTFGKNVVVAYNKDGNGYDKGDEVDAKGNASTAQFNMLVDVPEGKVAVIQANPATSFNKAEATKEGTEGNTYRLKLTKVTADVSVQALATIPVEVSYENHTSFTIEDNNKGAAPTNANDLAPLIFKVVHNSDNAEHTDIPVIAKIGEKEIALTPTDKGKNKDQFTVAKEDITDDILIIIGE